MKMRDFITIVENQIPKPTLQNIQDAIEHADLYGADWSREDFQIVYLGLMMPSDIEGYDDLSSWVEVDSADDLETFRDGSFSSAGSNAQFPPIIIITAPDEDGCHTQVGDGRGRVNWAVAHQKPLHVYHMIHKECSEN